LFDEAKQSYKDAAISLVELMKLTADDENFKAYLKQQLNYALQKAETCKTNMSTQLMSKTSAGYGKNSLAVDEFKELTQ
jgi:SpoVK/Ycf46/Vps4 family AAA+-type ATPase